MKQEKVKAAALVCIGIFGLALWTTKLPVHTAAANFVKEPSRPSDSAS
jgi:hypothetical protein